jgi:hypothetical protein
MHTLRSMFGVGLLAALAHMACAVGEVSSEFAALGGASACDTTYFADIEDDFDAQIDLATPGASPQFVFDAYIPGSAAKILQTYELKITLPAAFAFNGFGAAGASVGQLDFDFGSDHTYESPADYTIPHRAIDPNTAYADSLLNGAYDPGVDAVATHAIGVGGAHVFTISMPSGGTNFGGVCSYFDTSTRFWLPPGFVQLPSTPGSYDVEISALSVDPDTGDATDNAGLPPISYVRTVPIQVPEPAASAVAIAAIASLAALRGPRNSPARSRSLGSVDASVESAAIAARNTRGSSARRDAA